VTAGAGLFQPRGPSTFLPTSAAVGPWDQQIVHGAAIAALFAGRLTPIDRTLGRLTVELIAPVPVAPLDFECSEAVGGRRVQRQEAVLSAGGRVVATARSVVVRRSEVDLPPKALAHTSPFDPAAPPRLDEPNRAAAEMVGWESFDSESVILEWLRVPDDPRTHGWVALAVPVVEGTEVRATEVAAVAADYAQSAVSRQLPYASWSFRNAELTVHFAREPEGSWIGMRCESVVGPLGAGFNAADLFDQAGRVGRSASSLVVEHRDTGDALKQTAKADDR